MLVFIQGFKTEFYISSDEPSSSTTEDSVLISLIAYFKQNPVGCMNEMQGTEWHVSYCLSCLDITTVQCHYTWRYSNEQFQSVKQKCFTFIIKTAAE